MMLDVIKLEDGQHIGMVASLTTYPQSIFISVSSPQGIYIYSSSPTSLRAKLPTGTKKKRRKNGERSSSYTDTPKPSTVKLFVDFFLPFVLFEVAIHRGPAKGISFRRFQLGREENEGKIHSNLFMSPSKQRATDEGNHSMQSD